MNELMTRYGQNSPDHAALHRRLEQLRTAMGEMEAPTLQVQLDGAHADLATPESAHKPAARLPRLVLVLVLVLALGGTAFWGSTSKLGPTGLVAPAPAPAPIAASPLVPSTVPATVEIPPLVNEQNIRELVESWRLDWSRGDIDAYLSHYSASFVPAKGKSRYEWEASRRMNILSRPAIRVEVNDLRIDPLDDRRVRLYFLQNYISGTYQENAQPKTLQLVREAAGWKIAGEWQGSGPAKAHR